MMDIEKFCRILESRPVDMSVADLLLYLQEEGIVIPGITEIDEILLSLQDLPVDSHDSP